VKKFEEVLPARAGTLLMRDTIPMIKSVNRFAEHWRVELGNPTGNVSCVSYHIERLRDV